jgi:hypothetical protein
MTAAAPSNTEMLSGLTEYAYRLGKAFGAEAERAQGQTRIDAFNLYDRCFFSVRVAIGLQLRLRREDRAAGRDHAIERAEATEREADDSREQSDYLAPERDRERDRETEPAGLPVLLKTLNSVVADARTLPGPPPAALPALGDLLARFGDAPAPARRQRSDLRARLTGSASAPLPAHSPALRQSTGPPRR